MERSQNTGALIMIGAVFQMIVFLLAITRRSYVALALPMTGALATISALAFWIGWTMFTSEEEEEEEFGEGLPES